METKSLKNKEEKSCQNKANKSHILTKKTTKRKRNLRKATLVDDTNVKTMKKIMPYK